MAKRTTPPRVWKDGAIVPYAKASLGALCHSAHYGTGLFEGIRAYPGADGETRLFRAPEHYARLLANCPLLGYRFPYSAADLCGATIDLLRALPYRGRPIYIRPHAIIETEEIGINPGPDAKRSLVIIAKPLGKYIEDADDGIRATISSIRRLKDTMIPPSAKICGAYANSLRAVLEARERGFKEAILLTDDGFVSEGSGENIFLVQRGYDGRLKLVTPEFSDDILPGITRDSVIVIARILGIETIERHVLPSELFRAEEIFLTGTACEIAGVIEVDHRPVGKGRVGQLTEKLSAAYFAIASGNAIGASAGASLRLTPIQTSALRELQDRWTMPVYRGGNE